MVKKQTYIPVSNIVPLVFREGASLLELIHGLAKYVQDTLEPSLKHVVDGVVAEVESQMDQAKADYVAGVEEFQRIHDAFMQDVTSSLKALNDGAVTDLVEDNTSLLGDALRTLFDMRSTNNTKNYNGSGQERLQQAIDDGGTVQLDETISHQGNIEDFWKNPIQGTGSIDTGDGVFIPHPQPRIGELIVNTIYVNAQHGDDNNDGLTVDTPFRTVVGMYNRVLRRLTAQQAAQARWVIRLSGQFTGTQKFTELQDFPKGLVFQGERNGGVITTSFTADRESSGTQICFWVEPGVDTIEFYDIRFYDYRSTTALRNGYGVLMKYGGRVVAENCEFIECDTGSAAIQNVVFSFHENTVDECRTGFIGQYNSSGAFNRNTIENCENYGINVSRNTVCHVDDNTIRGNNLGGVRLDMASRASVDRNTIDSNGVGVLATGGAEWTNNDNTFTNNGVHYKHQGSAREIRMHSQGDNTGIYHRLSATYLASSYAFSQEFIGVSNNTLIYSGGTAGRIPEKWFTSLGKKITFTIRGRITSDPSYSPLLTIGTTRDDGTNYVRLINLSLPGGDGIFEATVDTYAVDENTQHSFGKVIREGSFDRDSQVRARTMDASTDMGDTRLVRVYFDPASNSSVNVEFYTLEATIIG